jgi:hypothetical protein
MNRTLSVKILLKTSLQGMDAYTRKIPDMAIRDKLKANAKRRYIHRRFHKDVNAAGAVPSA